MVFNAGDNHNVPVPPCLCRLFWGSLCTSEGR